MGKLLAYWTLSTGKSPTCYGLAKGTLASMQLKGF